MSVQDTLTLKRTPLQVRRSDLGVKPCSTAFSLKVCGMHPTTTPESPEQLPCYWQAPTLHQPPLQRYSSMPLQLQVFRPSASYPTPHDRTAYVDSNRNLHDVFYSELFATLTSAAFAAFAACVV
ncbi:unnamed protein product [Parajaminaea phylloscopi]